MKEILIVTPKDLIKGTENLPLKDLKIEQLNTISRKLAKNSELVIYRGYDGVTKILLNRYPIWQGDGVLSF